MLVATILVACESPGGLTTGGFRNDYQVARQALETGNYDLAIRRYDALRHTGGPLEARLHLEYAHSLLRGNRFEDAAREADALVAAQDGALRASALAVRGTARHEAARQLIAKGQDTTTARALLLAARADLDSFLKSHAGMDAADAMQTRARLITSDLHALGA